MMLQRFKNWLIKKLGGYTKAEYDDWSRIPITHYEFMPRQDKNVVDLTTDCEYSELNPPPRDWVEDRLIHGLATQIKPYVFWFTTEDRCRMTVTLRARLKVVDDK